MSSYDKSIAMILVTFVVFLLSLFMLVLSIYIVIQELDYHIPWKSDIVTICLAFFVVVMLFVKFIRSLYKIKGQKTYPMTARVSRHSEMQGDEYCRQMQILAARTDMVLRDSERQQPMLNEDTWHG